MWDLIASVGQHSLRLVTYRHDGLGLPRDWRFSLLLVILAVGVSLIRWGGSVEGLGSEVGLVFGLYIYTWMLGRYLGLQFLAGLLLISITIDLAFLFSGALNADAFEYHRLVFSLWELSSCVAFTSKIRTVRS